VADLSFADRFRGGDPLLGVFVKTPHNIVVEVIAGCGLDFVVLDGEHCPFGPAEIERCVLAARAEGLPILVRVPATRPEYVLQVLDAGADGILAPHVCDAGQAAALARSARYGEGGRGYAATTRAGRWGRRSIGAHLRASAETLVVAQIEDPEAVEAIDEIAAVSGIDALFVGRSDLTVGLGASGPGDQAVARAVARITSAARSAGRPVSMFLPSSEELADWRSQGVTTFLIGSEHSAIQTTLADIRRRFDNAWPE
jgi:2-keto-3-deoxy-L-rhamnonate aldolase RhmA